MGGMAHTRVGRGSTEDGRKRASKGHLRRHPDRISIELASLAGLSLDKIAARFNVGRDAVARHMKALDPGYRAALIADVPLEEMAERAAKEGLSILDQLAVLRQSLMHGAIEAKAASDHYAHATLSNAAVNAIRETARLTGELRSAPTITNITNNVAVLMASPVMQRLQAMLTHRLAPYPEALAAVLDGLAELDAGQESAGSPRTAETRVIEGTAHAA